MIYHDFLSKLCVGMHVSMYGVYGMPLNIYWAITTIYTQFLTLICPLTGIESTLIVIVASFIAIKSKQTKIEYLKSRDRLHI